LARFLSAFSPLFSAEDLFLIFYHEKNALKEFQKWFMVASSKLRHAVSRVMIVRNPSRPAAAN
jgi:hypothetical protein